jgi:hypothetical protein
MDLFLLTEKKVKKSHGNVRYGTSINVSCEFEWFPGSPLKYRPEQGQEILS